MNYKVKDMQRINPQKYSNFISYADINGCGKVYPLSISERIQYGEIFVNSNSNYQAVLFWHHCGFAYLSGKFDEAFLEDVYKLMLNKDNENPRRFILLVDDARIEKFFQSKDNIVFERRYLFEYTNEYTPIPPNLPSGYKLKEIDTQLLSKIHGNIVPALFWNDLNGFFEQGKGYCIIHGDNIAAWAFSSAISSTEIDIGIETDKNYQHRGFATIVANRMIQYAFEEGKMPAWACHYKNVASAKLAKKVGFVKKAECSIIKTQY